MTPDAPGIPRRPANQELLKAYDDQAKSMTAVYRRVVEMDRAGIEEVLFEAVSPQLALVENMIFEL